MTPVPGTVVLRRGFSGVLREWFLGPVCDVLAAHRPVARDRVLMACTEPVQVYAGDNGEQGWVVTCEERAARVVVCARCGAHVGD